MAQKNSIINKYYINGGNTMSEVIVVTSGKGGVGKTTTSANVVTGLAKLNKKEILID